jgi:hypothetical protein
MLGTTTFYTFISETKLYTRRAQFVCGAALKAKNSIRNLTLFPLL